MPLFVSTEGYGVLFDCCSLMTFNDEEESYLFLDTVDQIDYYFMGGNTMDGLSMLIAIGPVGKAQMLPKWAYGYIQSKEQYASKIRNCTPLQRNQGSAGLCSSGLEYLGSGQAGRDSGSVPLWG